MGEVICLPDEMSKMFDQKPPEEDSSKGEIEMSNVIELDYVDRGPCDKCRKPIEPTNNALYWQVMFQALKEDKDPVEELKRFAEKKLSPIQEIRCSCIYEFSQGNDPA